MRKSKLDLNDLNDIKTHYRLTESEFEYYIERTGIRENDADFKREKAHELTINEIINRREK